MPRTQGRYQQDLGFGDGIFLFGPEEIVGLVAADCVMTRNGVADRSLNVVASKTVTFGLNLGKLLQRTGLKDDVQEQFGGNYGPAGTGSRMGNSSQLTPQTAFRKKGVKIKGFKVIYLIGGAALTAHTCRVDKIIHANNTANAVTAVLASAANGLATAVQANPYVTTVDLPAAQQIYRVEDLAQLVVEVGVTTQVAGTYRMYGIEVLAEFNYN